MRLITRCPACGTLFKVVPDQLRISEGWVRCGHCAEVFDAPSHFFDPAARPPVPAALETFASASAEPVDAAPFADAAPMPEAENPGDVFVAPVADAPYPPAEPPVPAVLQDDPYVTDYFSALPAAQQSPAPWGEPTPAPLPDPVPTPEPEPEPELHPAPVMDGAAPALPVEPVESFEAPVVTAAELETWRRTREASSGLPPVALADDGAPSEVAAGEAFVSTTHDDEHESEQQADTGAVAATPAFVRQADRRAFWRRPRVRALMSVLMIVALLVLAGQVIYMERDRIAAHVPAARPVLERLCEPLGCRVSGLRQIESIVVDGSSFTRLRPDTYRLGVVLKSTASVPIAMPSVELTLTSLQGQTLLRRVLSPADLRAPGQLAAGAEWIGELPLVLDDADVASRVSGYAVLPFYP